MSWRAGVHYNELPGFHSLADLTGDITLVPSLTTSPSLKMRTASTDFRGGLLAFSNVEPAHGRGIYSEGSHVLPHTVDMDVDSTSVLCF